MSVRTVGDTIRHYDDIYLPSVLLSKIHVPLEGGSTLLSDLVAHSSLENLADVSRNKSPQWLLSRRALNTTPDSSLSTPSSHSRYHASSESGVSDTAGDECNVNQSNTPSSRSQWRHSEHRYVREESQNHKNSARSVMKATFMWIRHQGVYIFLLLPVFLFVCLWLPSRYRLSEQTVFISPAVSPLLTLTHRLSMEFPNQTNRLWTQLRAALQSQLSPAHMHSPLAIFEAPAVILFVNRISHTVWDQDVERERASTLFHCFQSRFRHFIAMLLIPMVPTVCSTVYVTSDNVSSAQVKLKMDEQLNRLYSQGIRCFNFPPLDDLPPEVVVYFHGVADAHNSIYKGAVLLFSLNRTFEHDDHVTHLESRSPVHREFEHEIQRYLRALWTSNLGADEADALLSRLTRNIAVFYTFPSTNSTINPCHKREIAR